MTYRRPLGPGVDHQEPVEVVPGARRTAVERAAEAALAEPTRRVSPVSAVVTGRRPLTLRTPEDQPPSAG
ncbi:hypothetical protein PUR71_00930 [Streptomyces sp. SP17BM10]|uniref:hypothetical protein n=1 Tax=Streptomyces sp. SP17BM10 TaxID=3002530 RepID=UPI002E76FE28|nr:hypothetical protein [Streptomyces sp. SP17BM10]MEE1781510.1 hypothetical protein [Streptomyces sp. SP17BM10]